MNGIVRISHSVRRLGVMRCSVVTLLSAYYALKLRSLGFTKTVKPFTKHPVQTLNSSDEALTSTAARAKRWCNVISAVSKRVPWNSACLVQALVASRIFTHKHIPYQVSLGVTMVHDSSMKAHAWLSCDGVILLGREGHKQFTPVYSFGTG